MAGKSERVWATPGSADRFAGLRGTEVRIAAGSLALLGAAAIALVRLVRNAPVDGGVLAEPGVFGVASGVAVVAPAVAAVTMGVVAPTDREWIALVFAGAFTLLTVVSGAITVPAAAVVVVAGALTLLPPTDFRSQRIAVPVAFVAALVLSLGAGAGLLPATARSAGTAITLVALAVTPLFVRPPVRALVVGVGAALAVAAVALAAPFATSASVLVVVAAIDPPFALLAASVGGAVATVAGGFSTGRYAAVVGGALLLAAGVPATVPRALAVVLGARLVLGAVDSPIDGGDGDAV